MAGTIPITAGVLKFSITFNLFAKTLTFTDLVQYYTPYGAMKGILSLVDPDGLIFYQNAGWPTQDFTRPDTNSTTPTWTKVLSGVNYPVDSAGNLKRGYYTINYMVTAGSVPYVVSQKLWNMDYVKVTPSVVMDANVLASTLTVTDETLYNVLHNQVAVIPSTTRLMTIQYPKDPATGTPVEVDVTTALSTITIGPDIYTSIFTALLSTAAIYNLELWDAAPCLIVIDTIQDERILDIKADNCMCQYYDCIAAVQLQMDACYGTDPAQYNKLRIAKDQLNDYVLLYQWALSCGKDASRWCTLIKGVLLATIPCECAEDTGAPVEIIPVIGSGGSMPTASTFKYTFGVGDAGFPAGAHALDVHEFTLTDTAVTHVYNKSDIYQYSGTAWVFKLNSQGVPGADGSTGTSANIIWNDSSGTGTDAGYLEKTLDTITFKPNDYADAMGDVLHIYAMFEMAQNGDGKTMRLYFGGDVIIEKFTDMVVNTLNNMVVMEMWITNTGYNTQDILAKLQMYNEVNSTFITKAKTWTSDQIFKMTGMNTVATPMDIISRKFLVEIIKVYP